MLELLAQHHAIARRLGLAFQAGARHFDFADARAWYASGDRRAGREQQHPYHQLTHPQPLSPSRGILPASCF
jgi:hypothetical protein